MIGAVAGAALALSIAVPAHADAYHGKEKERYRLTIVSGSLHDPAQPLDRSSARHVRLWCNPVGGNHPRPAQACRDIEEAGSIAAIREEVVCPMIYDPVTAFSRGSERYQETFANLCLLRGEKGAVFDF